MALQQLHTAVSHRRAQETASAEQNVRDSEVSLLELAVHTSALQVKSVLLKCKTLLSPELSAIREEAACIDCQ